MEELVKQLEEIYTLLEQINSITTNQTTILLQTRESRQEVNEVLDMLEGMLNYKDELITLVEAKEQSFEGEYAKYKGRITNPRYINLFKEWVERILTTKQTIVEAEQNNVIIMKSLSKAHASKVSIPKKPNEVVAAYQKQKTKT